MTRFSILMKWWLRRGGHNFVLRNLRGPGVASNFLKDEATSAALRQGHGHGLLFSARLPFLAPGY
jgi:hypothetical protein